MKANLDVKTVESSKDAEALAAEFASRLRNHFGGRLRLVQLYGSAARGDWTPESDIDVLVLLDHVSSEDGDWIAAQAFSLGVLEHGVVLQSVFMPEKDFERLKSRERRFAMDVEREGITL